MKIAVAGKGGVGKTTLSAWLGDYLARLGKNVWMIDADTALSLGRASGLERSMLPEALAQRKDILRERIRPGGGSMMNLTPHVGDLPESLSVPLPVSGDPLLAGGKTGTKRLLVMGALSNAGGGCACDSNALLKALLSHLVLEREEWVLVDMEAGVEHLGRGTVARVDHLLVVSEPGLRSLETAGEIGRMAAELGLARQTLILNRATPEQAGAAPQLAGLPERRLVMPEIEALKLRQLRSVSVLGLDPEAQRAVDLFLDKLLRSLGAF